MKTCLERYIITIVLAISTIITSGVWSLRCYQCFINPQPGQTYNTTALCIHFDYSDKFIAECPNSTMCMKQDISLDLPSGEKVTGVLRDCAFQRYDYLDFKNGRWTPKTEIREPYEEGCHNTDDKGERTAFSRYCYCRKELCNSSPNTNQEGYTDIMGVIVVFNLMKYINSLR